MFISTVLLWDYFVSSFAYVLTQVAFVIALRRYIAGGLCTSTKRLVGQTVIITGANIGIGKETARDLLRRGGNGDCVFPRDLLEGDE